MSALTSLHHARALMDRGFAVIAIGHRKKRAWSKGWPDLRISRDQLPKRFKNKKNIGVLLGEPSGLLVDVDLDHPLALQLAPEYMPHTGMVWGRASKPRSHLIYRVTSPIPKSRRWCYDGAKVIVELRSNRSQTIAPGSVHPSGELIRWDEDGLATVITPEDLFAHIESLVAAVRDQGGLRRRSPNAREVGMPGTHRKKVEVHPHPTPEVPIDPADPEDPADPADPVTVAALVRQEVVKGPGEHDARTMNLARGLKFDCRIPNCQAAMPYFEKWWAASKPNCSNQFDEEGRWKFERAWETAQIPLSGGGIAERVFALAAAQPLPEVPACARYQNPLVRLLVAALAEMGRQARGEIFALSSHQAGAFLGVASTQAHRWLRALVRDGVIECTDRGSPGKGYGRAARYRWVGASQAGGGA